MNALNISFKFNSMEEIVIIPKELISLVQKQYEQISRNYMGRVIELVTKIKEIENNIK